MVSTARVRTKVLAGRAINNHGSRGRSSQVQWRHGRVAARLSLRHSLPMADSLILATARAHDATVWTQDAHFSDLPGVEYFPRA